MNVRPIKSWIAIDNRSRNIILQVQKEVTAKSRTKTKCSYKWKTL